MNKMSLFCFRAEKKAFIRAKYEKHRYAIVTCTNLEDRRQDLKQAILSRDIFALMQVFAEGIDFMESLPDMVSDRVCKQTLLLLIFSRIYLKQLNLICGQVFFHFCDFWLEKNCG